MNELNLMTLGAPLLKPFFQFPIIILNAFIAIVVYKQAEGQTVGISVLFYAGTAFAVIHASRYRTSTFGYVFAVHCCWF